MAGFGDFMKLMSRMGEIQDTIKNLKTELPTMEFSSTSNNGKVRVSISGDFRVRSVILPADCSDKEQLAKDLTEAFDSAMTAAKMTFQEKLTGIASNFGVNPSDLK